MKIAIVEDQKQYIETLKDYIERYSQEKGEQLEVYAFSDGLEFLNFYKTKFDIVFMDIDMPHISGIETAKRLRQMDQYVCLIFITDLSQFAVNGYEVNAFDYIVKPIGYEKFCSRLSKAITSVNKSDLGTVCIKSKDFIKIVKITDIYYLESQDHKIIYHLLNEDIETWETWDKVEKKLPSDYFARCATSYLVNLSYVISVKGNEVFLPNATLPITRLKKKDFIDKLMRFTTL